MAEHNISDIVPEEFKERARMITKDHVDWFLDTIRPLLVTFGVHLYRHGWEDRDNYKKKEKEDGDE